MLSCSVTSDSATPWTVAHQAPLSMGFSRQEWVAMASSRGPSQPRDWTCISCVAGGFSTAEPLSSKAHRYRVSTLYILFPFILKYLFIYLAVTVLHCGMHLLPITSEIRASSMLWALRDSFWLQICLVLHVYLYHVSIFFYFINL